jgi:ParB family transcriptional regulator, chromosome partitioning protein
MRKKVLGRGLEVLIPEYERLETPPPEIDIDRIIPNPDQPRFRMDEQKLEELSASIREHGVLQPILVRPCGNGYQLVAGERRLSAAQRAGLLKIPAIVRQIPDDRLLELALIENIQREQLNPIEEAQACQRLLEELKVTQEELAQKLGKDRSTVANSLRLIKLPPPVKLLVADGRISAGHARALLGANVGPVEMARIAVVIEKKGWSVRDTERWAKKPDRIPRAPTAQDPNEVAATDRLRLALGTKVEIRAKSKGAGQIRIHFFSQEDLIRIFTLLTEKRPSNGARL